MSANHGNTPAAWTAVVVGLIGFVVGGIGMMFEPVNMTSSGWAWRSRSRPASCSS